MKTRQIITFTRTAKELLQKGFKIIDIAPHKLNNKRTIFIFDNTLDLQEYLKLREENVDAKTNPNQQNNIHKNVK